MLSLKPLAVTLGVAFATMPAAAFAQFPPPPPMASPAVPAAGPPRPGPGPGLGAPPPRLGPAAVPRADPAARGLGRVPTVANSARAVSVNIGRGDYAHHRLGTYGTRAASYAGAYAAGVYAGHAYDDSRSSYYASGNCAYVYRRHRRVLICD
ncbi:hypothetical protein E4K64_26660 [Bradyrhizobium frederickii]|uniref:Uncharacterized protein n=1 Tax=Bradyrhizobium frederickii TaxID=2560054 RepID=A0A4Y9NTX3_9BRAD|nr:hypothetical protein E4K64_26660 [Bradyrhizobium frederickii]